MHAFIKTGRYLLALAIIAFGIEQFIFQHPITAFIPMTGLVDKQLPIAIITGVLFIIAGLRIVFDAGGKYTAWFSPALFFILFLSLHLPVLLRDIHNGSEWTVCFELIAFCSGALSAVISSLNNLLLNYKRWQNVARILFAAALIVFSGLHFIYADYIATLIPTWIPFALFWAYFFGVAFIATAISLLLQLFIRLSCGLLSIMFFVWVFVLHLPRGLHTMHTEAEWTSLFVALGMASIALMFTGIYYSKNKIH